MADLEMLENWIKAIEERKKEIAKFEIKDRLSLVSSITKLHNAIAASLHGWAEWLKNPPIMEHLSEKELKETFEVYKKIAIDFMDLDVKMSGIVLKKQKKKRKGRKKKAQKEVYVA